jgi:hypothetical protein
MQLSSDDIVNSIVTKLRKDGYSEKDIEMAIKEAKKHYDAYLKKVKNPKPDRKEVDENAY